jgi:hypothetical protein
VISQVYGGAGCGTAGCSTYKNDYIELFNLGSSADERNAHSPYLFIATYFNAFRQNLIDTQAIRCYKTR